jgi:hypothetical protein
MINFIWPFEYLGPWTDLDTAGEPTSRLDRLAMIHDYAYSAADDRGGRASRVDRAKADIAMAGATDNYLIKPLLYTQAMIRVFTFNAVDLPW